METIPNKKTISPSLPLWSGLVVVFIVVSPYFGLAQASFSTVRSGNWTDGATWGNTSPGVDGVDYPDNNGDDDVTIVSGHVVTLQSTAAINNFAVEVGGVFRYNVSTPPTTC